MSSVYKAIHSHKCISELDDAMSNGDFRSLMEVLDPDFESLISNKVKASHELLEDSGIIKSDLRRNDLEQHIMLKYAKCIGEYSTKYMTML